MSVSSTAILGSVKQYFFEETRAAKADLAEKATTYLGEYAQHFIDFLNTYCGYPSNRPLNAARFYTVFIRSLAVKICQKAQNENQMKQRIPMLPELEKAIENIGYSFTMLRGTSHLCEVQISPK